MDPHQISPTPGHRSPATTVPPRAARLIRSVLITFSIAGWCRGLLADASFGVLLLVTCAWATTINLHLMRADTEAILGRAQGTRDGIGGFIAGQLLWLVPLLRTLSPDHWFWRPVHIPAVLILAGMIAAASLPVATLLARIRHKTGAAAPSAPPEFDLAVLCAAIFLATGALLWAAAAAGLANPIVATLVSRRRVVSCPKPTNACATVS